MILLQRWMTYCGKQLIREVLQGVSDHTPEIDDPTLEIDDLLWQVADM